MSAARKTKLLSPIAAGAVALSLLSASETAAQRAPVPKIVRVADFFFGPSAVTVQRGGAVRWVWSRANSNPHNVNLRQGPRGLRGKGSYSSMIAVAGARFQKSFGTPGSYRYVCTLHPSQMKMTVTVKR
jgi:plastocyanin